MFFLIETTLLVFTLIADPVFDHSRTVDLSPKNHSVRIYGGYESRPLMSFVLLGDIRREYHHTSISGIDLSRTLKRNAFNRPIDLSLRASFLRYNEQGFQAHHNQANLFLMAHFKTHYNNFPVRFFIGEGLSLSGQIPYVEGRETRRLSEKDSRLMNYLNVGFDFRLGDLTGNDALNNIRLGLADSHRSGAYKKVKWFNYTQGGSDFVTLFVEYDF